MKRIPLALLVLFIANVGLAGELQIRLFIQERLTVASDGSEPRLRAQLNASAIPEILFVSVDVSDTEPNRLVTTYFVFDKKAGTLSVADGSLQDFVNKHDIKVEYESTLSANHVIWIESRGATYFEYNIGLSKCNNIQGVIQLDQKAGTWKVSPGRFNCCF